MYFTDLLLIESLKVCPDPSSGSRSISSTNSDSSILDSHFESKISIFETFVQQKNVFIAQNVFLFFLFFYVVYFNTSAQCRRAKKLTECAVEQSIWLALKFEGVRQQKIRHNANAVRPVRERMECELSYQITTQTEWS